MSIRLGPPLAGQAYLVENGTGRLKHVHYWVGRAVAGQDVSSYQPNAEVDDVRWVAVDDAKGLLTYDYDRGTLAEALPYEKRSVPLVVLRHAEARARSLATTMVAAIEGAVVLCRAKRSVQPLTEVGGEMETLLRDALASA